MILVTFKGLRNVLKEVILPHSHFSALFLRQTFEHAHPLLNHSSSNASGPQQSIESIKITNSLSLDFGIKLISVLFE